MPRKSDPTTKYFRYRRDEKDGETLHHLDALKSNGMTLVKMQEGIDMIKLLEIFVTQIGTTSEVNQFREMRRLYDEQEYNAKNGMEPIMTEQEAIKFLKLPEFEIVDKEEPFYVSPSVDGY